MQEFKTQQPKSLTYITIDKNQGIKYFQLETDTKSQAKDISIGRTHDNGIQILDNTISKKHARISYASDKHYLTDLQSVNGVLINGTKMKKGSTAILNNNDKIQFGKYECLYCYHDLRRGNEPVKKTKSRINLKDYLFEESVDTKQKGEYQPKNSQLSEQKVQKRKQKRKIKQSKITIPNITDYLKIAEPLTNHNYDAPSSQNIKEQYNDNKSFVRTGVVSKAKQGRIKLANLDSDNYLSESDLEKYKLSQRQKNIYAQEQQAKKQLQDKQKMMKERQLKMEIERVKIAEDLLQKQLLLSEKVRMQQQGLKKQREKLQRQFVEKQQQKRQVERAKIQQFEAKQKQFIQKIEKQRQEQIQQLRIKQQKMKEQSEVQYKTEYQRRKRQLEMEAIALADNYERIYKDTIRKVRTQIENQQNNIGKLEQKLENITKDTQYFEDQIVKHQEELQFTRRQYTQIHGRNKAYVLYASELQNKIDAIADNRNKQGYYPGNDKGSNAKKLEDSTLNSRKLLKIKKNQHTALWEQSIATKGFIQQNNRSSMTQNFSEYLDTITSNIKEIERLKDQYLEQIESQKGIEDLWTVQLQEYSQILEKNRVLEADIAKNKRQIDENIRDQIRKSTEQRLQLLKAMHLCSEQKKNAARFLIEEMLSIEQENHRFLIEKQDLHQKIVKVINQSEKYKRENELLGQILFGQDENGHHFDNMKVVINNLIQNLEQQKLLSSVDKCVKLSRQGMNLELSIEEEVEKKKIIKDKMRKVGQMGIASQEFKDLQKNPLVFFGDLLTKKQIESDEKKLSIQIITNQNYEFKEQIKLLEEKKNKISHALQKIQKQELIQARKYITS